MAVLLTGCGKKRDLVFEGEIDPDIKEAIVRRFDEDRGFYTVFTDHDSILRVSEEDGYFVVETQFSKGDLRGGTKKGDAAPLSIDD